MLSQYLQRLGTPKTHRRGSIVLTGLITAIIEHFGVHPWTPKVQGPKLINQQHLQDACWFSVDGIRFTWNIGKTPSIQIPNVTLLESK